LSVIQITYLTYSFFGLEVIHSRGPEVTRGTKEHVLQRIDIEEHHNLFNL
jgi:hypothetical protein